jgi:calcineurin-like phosphoesterase family protein
MNVYFSADFHLGHSNILKYCGRPFKNIEEHDETIIKNFQEVLLPEDHLWLLGDISFTGRDLREYMKRLKCHKFLIKGNHDPKQFDRDIFEGVYDVKMIQVGEQNIWLSHYAHRQWPQSHYGAWHLYGHDHGTLIDYYRSCDIGVDNWEFKPVSMEQLEKRFVGREKMAHH